MAALEFALIAPLMILMFFGLSELSEGIMAARHTNHASSSLGDLAAQCATVNDTDLANMFGAAADILAPLPSSTLNLRVTSVVVTDNNGTTQVDWSKTPNGQVGLAAYAKNTPIALPTGLVSGQGDSVVMSEADYGFNFPIDLFNGLLKFNEVTYFKPRKTTQVVYASSGTSCYAS